MHSQIIRPAPRGIQRKRTKGWRKPPETMIVDRTSRWGNPFRPYSTVEVRRDWFESGWYPSGETITIHGGGREHCAALFRVYAVQRSHVEPDWLEPLRGKNLACYCEASYPYCHRNILLELANRPAKK